MGGLCNKITGWMKRVIFVAFLMACMSGCAIEGQEEAKLRDLEFTVVPEEEQPQALLDVIEEKKTSPFQISYTLGEDLFLAIGYGEQQTGGYSICVNSLYETDNHIVADTTLMGPGSEEKVIDSITYPYIVIKMELIDKDVDFR